MHVNAHTQCWGLNSGPYIYCQSLSMFDSKIPPHTHPPTHTHNFAYTYLSFISYYLIAIPSPATFLFFILCYLK